MNVLKSSLLRHLLMHACFRIDLVRARFFFSMHVFRGSKRYLFVLFEGE
jgi:hypothetical protein